MPFVVLSYINTFTVFSKTGLPMDPWLALNSLRSACLCLQSSGIKGRLHVWWRMPVFSEVEAGRL